jgi:hypothetical protein
MANATLMQVMPNVKDRQVTVRRLPDGEWHAAFLDGLDGQLMRIDLAPAPAAVSLRTGDLVEVTCENTLYLGEIRSLQNATMVIGVEHALDRQTLALIQQVWHGPAGQ